MAILRNVEVTTSAKGKRRHEYDDDAEEPCPSNTATKHIEALTGADFQIHYAIKPTFRLNSSGIVVRVTIDGEYMDSRQSSEDTVVAPESRLRNLVSDLGLIKVEIHQVTYMNRPGTFSNSGKLRASDAFPEKALKGQALFHRASLGSQQRIAPIPLIEVNYVDGFESPFAVFNFKYCSRKSLQAILTITRTPSPVLLEQRPINQATHEEVLELLKRRPIQVEPKTKPAVSVKREHDHLDPESKDDEEYLALLASARAQKVARVQKPVDGIDLLDD